MSSMHSNLIRNLVVLALVAGSARAQSFNVDIGDQPPASPVPSNAYGGAAGQSGVWNDVPAAIAVPVPLVDINNALTNVTLGRVGGSGALDADDPGTVGDDQALLDDCQSIGVPGATTTWTFANLAAGGYRLYTYGWTPVFSSFFTNVTAGTISPPQTCGGAWPGAQQLGVTYVVHEFSLTVGSSIDVTLVVTGDGGGLGGFQLVQLPPPGTYLCFGDGSGTPCPTGNNSPSGAQAGCLNSLGMGAIIEATGNPSLSADTLHFQGSGMTFGSCLYFQGDALAAAGAGVPFGDGLLCLSGTMVRLGVKFNGHGSSEYPGAGDPPVSMQGLVSTPGFKYYEVWYRDAATFGSGATFNTSRTVCIPWVP